MSFLDGRHRWEVTDRAGSRITHTCRACGRVEVYETLIPESVIWALTKHLTQPNPYRALFR